jgi:hypothetical protein
MGKLEKLAAEIGRSLEEALPGIRKTILKKLPLAVAAMLEARTSNTMELSTLLPLDTERADMREQWLRRLLSNPLLDSGGVLAPFARQALKQAASCGQTILLSMDQTDLGERFAVLMISVRCGDRSLPLVWQIESGEANIGFAGQQGLLERVRAWLPEGAAVMLLADRFYPSAALFEWLIAAGWQYRLRLRDNLVVDVGCAGVATTGDLAAGVRERYEANARLFEAGVPTAIGVLHERGHPEPWIIAMNCPPNRAAVLDYGARWAIEPMFSDFKSRGFRLEDTKLEVPKRLDGLILIMALAMYWCVQAGQEDARCHPAATEKKPVNRPIPTIGVSARPTAAPSPGSNAASAFS